MKVFSGNITLIINKHQQTQSISNARYAHPFSTIRANLTNIYSLHRQATFLKKNVSVAFASEHFSARRNLHNTRLLYIANYQRRHTFDVTRVCASSFIRINWKKNIFDILTRKLLQIYISVRYVAFHSFLRKRDSSSPASTNEVKIWIRQYSAKWDTVPDTIQQREI